MFYTIAIPNMDRKGRSPLLISSSLPFFHPLFTQSLEVGNRGGLHWLGLEQAWVDLVTVLGDLGAARRLQPSGIRDL
jgi:hypothetical protein